MAPGDSISGKVRILIDMDGVLCDWERKLFELRVVQTLAILFLKSMSERGGFDIKRLCIWMTSISIDFESIENLTI